MNNPVVDFKELDSSIVIITMQDKVNKNTFTNELLAGLLEAFDRVEKSQTYKAVILTGYENYFASGGTQEGLIAIQESKAKFSDTLNGKSMYSMALDCKIPVISAMQGHGIGGGFAMGLFADFVLLSRESFYTANFMKYGFTPGFGATFILPEKLGFALAEEMLLNAGNYRGADLEKRGIPFRVLPREEVLEQAIELARQLAEKPRFSLITLKDHLVASIREKLPKVIEQEVIMHDKTFHQPEVKEKIMTLFGR